MVWADTLIVMVHHHHLVAKGVKLMTYVKPIAPEPTTGSLIINQTASFATRSLTESLSASTQTQV